MQSRNGALSVRGWEVAPERRTVKVRGALPHPLPHSSFLDVAFTAIIEEGGVFSIENRNQKNRSRRYVHCT